MVRCITPAGRHDRCALLGPVPFEAGSPTGRRKPQLETTDTLSLASSGCHPMPTYFHSPIWADPMWDCERREILPEDDERLIHRCDHCDRFARFIQERGWDDDYGRWCEEHVPRHYHPDASAAPFEVSPFRWPSLRAWRLWRHPPTPAPKPYTPRRWNVSDLAALPAAIEALYRRPEVCGYVEVWTPEEWELNPFGGIEIPNVVFIWLHRRREG